MIAIRTSIVAGSRSGTGSAWLAVADGIEARSRHGAAAALARQLVAAGLDPSEPVQITFDNIPGAMTFRSLGALAAVTYSEGNSALRRVPWQPREFDRPAAWGEAGDTGEDAATTPGAGAGNDAPTALPVSVTVPSCAGCGQPLTKRAGARTCSPACRKRLSRATG